MEDARRAVLALVRAAADRGAALEGAAAAVEELRDEALDTAVRARLVADHEECPFPRAVAELLSHVSVRSERDHWSKHGSLVEVERDEVRAGELGVVTWEVSYVPFRASMREVEFYDGAHLIEATPGLGRLLLCAAAAAQLDLRPDDLGEYDEGC